MSFMNWNRSEGFFPSIPSFFDNLGLDDDFLASFWAGKKVPAVNISETEDTYLVELAAPGMNKEDFEVSVKDGMLVIRAQKELSKEEKEKDYRRREYSFTSFERRFSLPDNISSEAVKARYESGVLMISLEKKVLEAPKKVEVEVL